MRTARFNGHLYRGGVCPERGVSRVVSAWGGCAQGWCVSMCVCVCVCVSRRCLPRRLYTPWIQRQTPPGPRDRHPPGHCMLGYILPVDKILDTRLWKHYLPAIAGGKNDPVTLLNYRDYKCTCCHGYAPSGSSSHMNSMALSSPSNAFSIVSTHLTVFMQASTSSYFL